MNEMIFEEGSEFSYIRHNEISPGRITLLFMHGLGDCGLCFQEVWDKLVEMGKLRSEGLGLYELIEDPTPKGKWSNEIYDK